MAKEKTKAPKRSEIIKQAWKGMPEFHQPNAGPVKSLIVNFQTMEDVHQFAKIIGGQLITAKTRSVWYPAVPEELALDKRWSDAQPSKVKTKK